MFSSFLHFCVCICVCVGGWVGGCLCVFVPVGVYTSLCVHLCLVCGF